MQAVFRFILAAKTWCFGNYEKIIFVIALLFGSWFMMTGTSRLQPVEWKLESAQKGLEMANQNMTHGTPDVKSFNRALEFIPYDQKAQWIQVGIRPEPYRLPQKWEQPILVPKTPREDPVILPPSRLRASSGYGAVKIKKNTSTNARTENKEAEGRRWIVVTGLIPVQDQIRIYNEAFTEAMNSNPMRDRPVYLAYKLERAEYNTAKGEPGIWKEIDPVRQQNQTIVEWEGTGTEPVVADFLVPSQGSLLPFAFPLPPLSKKTFGQEVAFPPEIPLKSEYELEQARLKQEEESTKANEVVATTETGLQDLLEGTRSSSSINMASSASSVSGTGTGRGTSRRDSYSGDDGSGMSGMASGSGFQSAFQRPMQVNVQNYLFRYLDFDVEEGKNYVYRVKLIVENPNKEMEAKYLANPSSARVSFLMSEYSDPTPPISIGSVASALVREVIVPRRGSVSFVFPEPSARLMSVYFNLDDATEWTPFADERPLTRGTIANLTKVASFTHDVKSDKEKDNKKPGEVGKTATKSTKNNVETQPVDIQTNLCLVDTFGGYEVEGKAKSPGKILFLDSNGSIIVRDTLEDFSEIQRLLPK